MKKKIPIIHSKRKHAPIVLLKFVTCISGWPKTLYSDAAGEFKSQVLKTMFLTKVCNHIKMLKDDHHTIGKTDSDVSELDKMTRATIMIPLRHYLRVFAPSNPPLIVFHLLDVLE